MGVDMFVSIDLKNLPQGDGKNLDIDLLACSVQHHL